MKAYDAHDWRSHLFDIHGSLVPEIALRVLACSIWSAVVFVLHHFLPQIAISATPHSLAGAVLSLLLVFRTNASYDRFWEGRKLWGSIVNETRNLARSAGVLIAADPAIVRAILRWEIAFCWSAAGQLQGRIDLSSLEGELTEAELKATITAPQPALVAARKITQYLDDARRQGIISDILFTQIDNNVQILVDCLGACQRIHQTPIPYAYMVHLRRALILYTFTLPFALVESFGAISILATFIIAYILFGIEEIGVEIEDPFELADNDIPLIPICTTIEKHLRSVMPTETT